MVSSSGCVLFFLQQAQKRRASFFVQQSRWRFRDNVSTTKVLFCLSTRRLPVTKGEWLKWNYKTHVHEIYLNGLVKLTKFTYQRQKIIYKKTRVTDTSLSHWSKRRARRESIPQHNVASNSTVWAPLVREIMAWATFSVMPENTGGGSSRWRRRAVVSSYNTPCNWPTMIWTALSWPVLKKKDAKGRKRKTMHGKRKGV